MLRLKKLCQILSYIKPHEFMPLHFDTDVAQLPLFACLSCQACLHHLLLQPVDHNGSFFFSPETLM